MNPSTTVRATSSRLSMRARTRGSSKRAPGAGFAAVALLMGFYLAPWSVFVRGRPAPGTARAFWRALGSAAAPPPLGSGRAARVLGSAPASRELGSAPAPPALEVAAPSGQTKAERAALPLQRRRRRRGAQAARSARRSPAAEGRGAQARRAGAQRRRSRRGAQRAPQARAVYRRRPRPTANPRGKENVATKTETLPALEAADDIALADRLKEGRDRVLGELRKLIIGQDDVLEQVLLSLFVGGNSILIGVPGLAKTLIVHTLAQVLDLKFNRIQFTPDLMPTDITGTDIIQEDPATGRRQMVFSPGPIFANIVLADEINRAPPKTQSALLEAMQEHRVTIQGRTYTLEEPFYVFATQNPIEL